MGEVFSIILTLYIFSVKGLRVEGHFHFLRKVLHPCLTSSCSVPTPMTNLLIWHFSVASQYLNVLPHFQGDDVLLQEVL